MQRLTSATESTETDLSATSLIPCNSIRQCEDEALATLRDQALQIVNGQDTVANCVFLELGSLVQLILHEAHDFRHSIHLDMVKVYRDLRQHYWWDSMQWDIADYVSCCFSFQQVKIEHQKPDEGFRDYP